MQFFVFSQNILGSSLLSPAHGCGGARAIIEFNNSPSAKKSGEARKQAGKKEGGLGEGIFTRLRFPRRRRGWGRSVSAIPPKAEYQNRKIFVSLIEKILARGRLKNVKKIFLFCSPKRSGGGRKRWAGLPPCGRQSKFAVRIFVKKSSDFVQKVPPFYKIRFLGDCCLVLAEFIRPFGGLGLGFGEDFEGKFEIQKQFLPA